jgi:16S rRNA (uracil1498-N3)-methyltransferase
MSERFYVNLPLAPGAFALDGAEAHHLAAVCRVRPGNEVCLFNGDGCEYPARVTHVARREIALEILRVEQPQRELPFALEVAAALPKGSRSQFLVEKLTELGVANYVPLACHRSNVHPRDSKREKLERYVIEASKQCGRNVLMKVDEMTAWEMYCARGSLEELRMLAHPYQAEGKKVSGTFSEELGDFHAVDIRPEKVPDTFFRGQAARIAVGPEGGFSNEEVALAIRHGWRAVSLGPRILRVETAALALVANVIEWANL